MPYRSCIPAILLRLSLLLVAFMLLSPLAQAAAERRIALVIGNGAYADAPLPNPVNDAKDLAAALKKLGFEVILRTNAGQRAMDEAIGAFGSRLQDGGVGLFFYAGHGIQSRGRNYLIPVGARLKREADLKYRAVDAGAVLDEMAFANNGLNIVVLDACRNNPLARSFRSAKRGLARPTDVPSGVLLGYSTAPGQEAADGDGRNSPYVRQLLQAIKQPGRPLELVFKDVTRGVKRSTRGRQIPWVSSSVTGDFYFSAAEPVPPVTDVDGDGVWDSQDICIPTPEYARGMVNEQGAVDEDEGGVYECRDRCRHTPKGAPVDEYGCQIDHTIVINNINFAFDKANLDAESRATLDVALHHVENNPKVIGLVLDGHTDSTGPADYNQGLSVRRAQSLANYLANHGVSASIMQVVGHGESQPIASNATKEGRAENRRIEIDVDVW